MELSMISAGQIVNTHGIRGEVKLLPGGVEAEQLEETLYSVNVMVELLGEDGETVVGLESWSFPYAFVNDRWVFTDFRLVY